MQELMITNSDLVNRSTSGLYSVAKHLDILLRKNGATDSERLIFDLRFFGENGLNIPQYGCRFTIYDDVEIEAKTRRSQAEELIVKALEQEGMMLVSEIDKRIMAEGFSRTTVKRAKKNLYDQNVICYQRTSCGKGKGVVWYMALNAPVEVIDNE